MAGGQVSVAKLVQRRLLQDVVVKDYAAIAANASRTADADVVALHRRLEHSTFDEIRRLAREVRDVFTEMAEKGLQVENVPVASKDHMEELVDLFEQEWE